MALLLTANVVFAQPAHAGGYMGGLKDLEIGRSIAFGEMHFHLSDGKRRTGGPVLWLGGKSPHLYGRKGDSWRKQIEIVGGKILFAGKPAGQVAGNRVGVNGQSYRIAIGAPQAQESANLPRFPLEITRNGKLVAKGGTMRAYEARQSTAKTIADIKRRLVIYVVWRELLWPEVKAYLTRKGLYP
jgi:hypothetical protein